MIDIDYYRKIQNACGVESLQEAKRSQVKQDLNRDFKNTLDAYKVTIDDVEQDLTILKTNDSHTKKIKSRPNESFNAGQIVYWQNSHWLINEVDTNNDIITHGKMVECNHILYWQDNSGDIISRYVYVEDFTKYSNGETGNSTIIIGDNQYGVYIPIDKDTKKLKRGMRFVFDFEDSENPDVYALTNRKINLYNYETINKGGIILLTFSFDAFNSATDKKVMLDDSKQIWICNYSSSTSTPIIVGGDTLRVGRKKTFSIETVYDIKWVVISDFSIETKIMNNKIQLFVDDDSLVGESFILRILDANKNDSVLAEKTITIISSI